MRLFTGIDLDFKTRENVAALLASFRPMAPLLWSPSENLHITTKFIGEVPDEEVEELTAALQQVPVPKAFTVRLHAFGWFPNPHNPRNFFIGIDAGDSLSNLALAINKLFLKSAFPLRPSRMFRTLHWPESNRPTWIFVRYEGPLPRYRRWNSVILLSRHFIYT